MNEYARKMPPLKAWPTAASLYRAISSPDFGDQKFTVAGACVVDYVKDTAAFGEDGRRHNGCFVVGSRRRKRAADGLRRYRYTTPAYHYNEAGISGVFTKDWNFGDLLPMQGGITSIAWK